MFVEGRTELARNTENDLIFMGIFYQKCLPNASSANHGDHFRFVRLPDFAQDFLFFSRPMNGTSILSIFFERKFVTNNHFSL